MLCRSYLGGDRTDLCSWDSARRSTSSGVETVLRARRSSSLAAIRYVSSMKLLLFMISDKCLAVNRPGNLLEPLLSCTDELRYARAGCVVRLNHFHINGIATLASFWWRANKCFSVDDHDLLRESELMAAAHKVIKHFTFPAAKRLSSKTIHVPFSSFMSVNIFQYELYCPISSKNT